jgi:hypothetical protein
MFLDVVENNYTTITHDWVIDLNNGTETFIFRMLGHSYVAHIFNQMIG